MSCNSAALGKRARSTSVDHDHDDAAVAAAETLRRGEQSQLPALGAESPETSGARAARFKRAKTAHHLASPAAAPAVAVAAAQPFVPGTWTGGWAQFGPRRESVAARGGVFVAPYGAPAPVGGMWAGTGGFWEEPTPAPSARGTPARAGEEEELPLSAVGVEVVDSWDAAPVAAPTVPTSPRHSVAPNWDTTSDEDADDDDDDDDDDDKDRSPARAAIAPALLAALHDDQHHQEGVVASTHVPPPPPPPVACDHPPPYDACIATLPPGSGPDVVVRRRTTTFCARTKERYFGMLSQYDLGAAMAAPPPNRERSWSERADVSPLSQRPPEEEEKEEKGAEEEAGDGSGEKDSYGLSPGIVNWQPPSPWPYDRWARELALSDAGDNEGGKKEAEDAGGEESEEEQFVPWEQPSPWPDYSQELEQSDEEGAVPPWGVLSPFEYKIWHNLEESGKNGVGPSTSTPEENEESGDQWFPFRLPSPWPGYGEEGVEGSEGVAPFGRSSLDGCRDTFCTW